MRRTSRLGIGLALAAAKVTSLVTADRLLAARRGREPIAPLRMLVVVDAPVEEVWAVLADIPLQPAWMHEMKAVRVLTPGPVGVGTRGEATVRILGIAVNDPVEVTAFDPPSRFAIRHAGRFTGSGEITLEPGADGATTVVRWEETLVAPVLPDLFARLAAPVLRAIFQADLHRLRALVESGGVE